MEIRDYRSSDCACLAELFHQTVHAVNAKDYDKAQLDAWASGIVDLDVWDKSFAAHHTLVAVKDGIIVGFGDIDQTGYLDRLYVHRDYQRQGIATALCERMERAFDVDKITTHASITARTFFMCRGYMVVREQRVMRRGITLTNFVMEKEISR